MTLRCSAVVEGGLLRPTEPIALEEGARVELIIRRPEDAGDRRTASEILNEIASLPMEPGGEEFSGRDHDRVLAGRTP